MQVLLSDEVLVRVLLHVKGQDRCVHRHTARSPLPKPLPRNQPLEAKWSHPSPPAHLVLARVRPLLGQMFRDSVLLGSGTRAKKCRVAEVCVFASRARRLALRNTCKQLHSAVLRCSTTVVNVAAPLSSLEPLPAAMLASASAAELNSLGPVQGALLVHWCQGFSGLSSLALCNRAASQVREARLLGLQVQPSF